MEILPRVPEAADAADTISSGASLHPGRDCAARRCALRNDQSRRRRRNLLIVRRSAAPSCKEVGSEIVRPGKKASTFSGRVIPPGQEQKPRSLGMELRRETE